jgi:hypothetical protein
LPCLSFLSSPFSLFVAFSMARFSANSTKRFVPIRSHSIRFGNDHNSQIGHIGWFISSFSSIKIPQFSRNFQWFVFV